MRCMVSMRSLILLSFFNSVVEQFACSKKLKKTTRPNNLSSIRLQFLGTRWAIVSRNMRWCIVLLQSPHVAPSSSFAFVKITFASCQLLLYVVYIAYMTKFVTLLDV